MEPPLSEILLVLSVYLIAGPIVLSRATNALGSPLLPWHSRENLSKNWSTSWVCKMARTCPERLEGLWVTSQWVGWLGLFVTTPNVFPSIATPVLGIGHLSFLFSFFLLTHGLLAWAVSWKPEGFLRLIHPVSRLTWLVMPLSDGLGWFGRSANGESGETQSRISPEELAHVTRVAVEDGLLNTEQERLLGTILEYGDTLARAVMVPRTDVVGLSVDADLTAVLMTIEEEGFSRYPVYEESVDRIVGVFFVKDMLSYLRGPRKESFDLRRFIRYSYFVPETKRISELMRELQGQKQHMALIVDEFGGTAGLVTQEDIIEEIFGEIYDETDEEVTPPIQELGENHFLVDARVPIRDFEEYFGMTFPEDSDYDTLAGFVVAEVGRVPRQGETLTLDQMQLLIREADETHLATVEVQRMPSPSDNDDTSETHVEASKS